MSLQLLKDHGPSVIQSVIDTKTAAAGMITTAGAVTVAVTEPESVTLAIDQWAVIGVIFSTSATGLCMFSAFILNMIKVRNELKKNTTDED